IPTEWLAVQRGLSKPVNPRGDGDHIDAWETFKVASRATRQTDLRHELQAEPLLDVLPAVDPSCFDVSFSLSDGSHRGRIAQYLDGLLPAFELIDRHHDGLGTT